MGRRVIPTIVVVTVAGALATPVAWQAFSRAEADRCQKKLAGITQYGGAPQKRAAAARSTQLSDAEVTAYIRHHAKEQTPVGVVEPTITALGDGRVGGRAIVDLDAVRKQKQRGWLDPLAYLSGRVPVTATGRLTTKDGVGKFALESAEISSVPVPKAVIQELLSFYSRTPQNPDGINMDDPFELPARIREIRVAKGAATVVQ